MICACLCVACTRSLPTRFIVIYCYCLVQPTDPQDNHLKPPPAKGYVHKGTPAIDQLGGTLIVATNEFTNKGELLDKHHINECNSTAALHETRNHVRTVSCARRTAKDSKQG